MMIPFLFIFLLCAGLVYGSVFSPASEASSFRAARLIVDAIKESESGTGAHFGSTPSTAYDLYVALKGGQVKTYEPSLFRRIRSNAGVSETAWLSCMNPDQLETVCADSKSGQSFWRSKDGTTILKTIKHYECKNLRDMLDNLANHLDVPFEHSCITGVLGAFRVKLANGKKLYFMAARNVYPTIQWYKNEKYDLKGSTVGRLKSPRSEVMKDLDLIRSGTRLQLGGMKAVVLRTLERDAHFLSKCGFMDYSLLVDVEHVPVGFLSKVTSRILNPTSGMFRVKYVTYMISFPFLYRSVLVILLSHLK